MMVIVMDTPSSSQEETTTRKQFRHEEPSQFRHWRFSHAQLAEIRKANNAAAIERVKKNKEAEKNQRQDDDKTTTTPEISIAKTFESANADANDAKTDQSIPAETTEGVMTTSANPEEKAIIESSAKIEIKMDAKKETDDSPKGAEGIEEPEVRYLTVDEELTLCSFYEFKLQQMALFCKLPDIVWATAIIYMKRFYLHNSIMDYHPKHVCITALFLATKSENERMSIEQFCADMRKTKEAVLSLEFVISQGLKFEYYIHHPFRACHGLFLDIDTNTKDTRKLREAYYKATDNVRRSLFSDLCFLYQPSQIALGCFKRAGREMQWDGVEKFIAEKFSAHLVMLAPILEDVIRTLDNYKAVEQGMAARIDRVLIKSSNPAKNPESALYKKREADREQAEEEKRQKKLKAKEDNIEDLESIVL